MLFQIGPFFKTSCNADIDAADLSPRKEIACGPLCPYDFSLRSRFHDEVAGIYGWPSPGGVIILNNAQAIDFEFVGLNPLDPQLERDEHQDAEDAFCQRLLLLGAKWWDSVMRYDVVAKMKAGIPTNDNRRGIRFGPHPPPTIRERRWVCVGWPSTGGLWVADFDVTWGGQVEDEDDLPPEGVGLARVYLARSMDERCEILQKYFEAKFYKKLEDYEGPAFLRSGEWKQTEESGPTMLTDEETFELWRKNLSARDPA